MHFRQIINKSKFQFGKEIRSKIVTRDKNHHGYYPDNTENTLYYYGTFLLELVL